MQDKFDVKVLIATLVAGVAAWGVDMLLYPLLSSALPRPLLIAVMFAVLAVLTAGAAVLVSALEGGFKGDFLFLSSTGAVVAGLVVALLLTVGLAGVFEWIYDRESATVGSASSYVFLVDESGSMSSTDPQGLRYTALEDVLAPQANTFPYAVYAFSDDARLLRSMAPISDGSGYSPPSDMGGMTNFKPALELVLQDIASGRLNGGSAMKVVLLTDGYASDITLVDELSDYLRRFVDAGVSVSIVGLGTVGDALTDAITSRTGGIFVSVYEARDLSQGMLEAATGVAYRDLLSSRATPGRDLLYGAMRVIFLLLLGVLLTFLRAMACGRDLRAVTVIVGSVAALVGGLLMEFGISLGAPVWLCWLLLWLLLSVTPAFLSIQITNTQSGYVHSSMYSGGSGGIKFH